MKKLFLVGALALFGAMNAQTTGNFKLGAHVGLPTGDAGDAFSFNAGVDVAYTWKIAENFDLGVATGYSQYFWKSDVKDALESIGIDVPNAGFIPIAATGQYAFGKGFFLGADLGYAISTAKDSDGGFYYQPKVGYTFQEKNDLYISYKGISNDGSISSINLGYAYRF